MTGHSHEHTSYAYAGCTELDKIGIESNAGKSLDFYTCIHRLVDTHSLVLSGHVKFMRPRKGPHGVHASIDVYMLVHKQGVPHSYQKTTQSPRAKAYTLSVLECQSCATKHFLDALTSGV